MSWSHIPVWFGRVKGEEDVGDVSWGRARKLRCDVYSSVSEVANHWHLDGGQRRVYATVFPRCRHLVQYDLHVFQRN